jgi:hypothetical protein
MRTLASALMSVCLVAHAALGCCWHHQHARSGHQEVSLSVDHGEHHDCPVDESGSHDCRIDCHRVCVFLAFEKMGIDDSSTMLAFAALRTEIVSQQTGEFAWHHVDAAESPPPTRLYLLHQILLI